MAWLYQPRERQALGDVAKLAAVEAQRQRSEGRAVVGWLLAPTVTASARALLLHAGAVATSLTPAQ